MSASAAPSLVPSAATSRTRMPIATFSRWIWYALLWTTIAAVFTGLSALVYLVMASFGHGRAGGAPRAAEWAASFATMLADWYLWALIAPLVIWLGARLSFARRDRVRVIAAHVF